MLVLYTAPVLEPISLAELKLQIKQDSGTFSDNVDEVQSLVPDEYAIAADYTTHVGTGIEVLGYEAIVILNSGTNQATGTVDCKIQESDDDITYTDWATGAFTQVTTANDNAIQEKAYTGSKRYIRTVAMVLNAACEFGTTVIRLTGDATDDDLLNDILETARQYVEDITHRALLTQTWYYYLDAWPSDNYIKMPLGNLQSTDLSIKWKDTDGTETTMTLTTDYLIETNGEKCGRIVLPYSIEWPTTILYPSNPIKITFKCGWTAAEDVPVKIRTAVKMVGAKLYSHRGDSVYGMTVSEDEFYQRLLHRHILWDEFL